jgi:hypothetical protein
VAHEAEGAQELHDAPAPAITPSLPMAENSEIARRVSLLPHWGQAMGASAFDIARRASKRVLQSEHLYSYSGIVSTSILLFAL